MNAKMQWTKHDHFGHILGTTRKQWIVGNKVVIKKAIESYTMNEAKSFWSCFGS